MLISAGDDTKLFAYSANEFTKFAPHDISALHHKYHQFSWCVGQLTVTGWLIFFWFRLHTDMVARVKSTGLRKIACSSISPSGRFFAYSSHVKPCLFELKKGGIGKNIWFISKRKLPSSLPFAHSMIFTSDSSRLMISGHDRMIYINVGSLELTHRFTPCRKECDEHLPPITKMFTSADG
ncbi:hypothetical protein HanIR_Chr15g0780291 [Helianthus annuus]|nr:hypothetical protein HanIR_Chr15g0780291 [Helianthus annuus]